jgi:hypothetical protein
MKWMAHDPHAPTNNSAQTADRQKGLTIPVGPLYFCFGSTVVRDQTLFCDFPVLEGMRLLKKNRASERLPGSGSPVMR